GDSGSGDSGATAALTIVREPFWHQTAWFRALLVVALAMAAWLIYRAALYQVHRRQRLLEGLVAQRTRELSEALTKVERLSRIDGLTGVANRRYLEEQLARSWAEASRRKAPLSLLMIDLDHFKEFNDSAGHLAGDECLKQVARTLEECVERSTDLVARFGGEEFVVLLPDTDSDGAESVGERIRERIDDLKFAPPEGGQGDGITASVGCATARPGRSEQRTEQRLRPEQLLRRADEAMYAAKRAGRNRVAGTG
ncbi:MAG: GGDEF domain-containing protein, partial [Wenzhouxiangellaceae bacterium]|nr:GGDEF domain-containing protein [Wenzhouxiangellaceae bacterium]